MGLGYLLNIRLFFNSYSCLVLIISLFCLYTSFTDDLLTRDKKLQSKIFIAFLSYQNKISNAQVFAYGRMYCQDFYGNSNVLKYRKIAIFFVGFLTIFTELKKLNENEQKKGFSASHICVLTLLRSLFSPQFILNHFLGSITKHLFFFQNLEHHLKIHPERWIRTMTECILSLGYVNLI